jgi:hypothetical protein
MKGDVYRVIITSLLWGAVGLAVISVIVGWLLGIGAWQSVLIGFAIVGSYSAGRWNV